MRLNISSSVLAKAGSSSLQSHIAYTKTVEKGDINIARHFGRLKEESNIKFEQPSVKTFREAQGGGLYYI